jgi:hypothetical protein
MPPIHYCLRLEYNGFLGLVDHHYVEYKEHHRCHSTGGLRNKVKIIIGGAPVTQAYADQIGGGCPLSG